MKRREYTQKCPGCGMGVMPGSQFCIHCGERIPDPKPTPEALQWEEEKKKKRFRLWFFDIFPGLLSSKVVVVSIAGMVLSLTLVFLYKKFFLLCDGLDAFFYLPLALLSGAGALMSAALSLGWLVCGAIRYPVATFAELNGRKWLALWTLFCLFLAFCALVIW
jgi:hypothetical protein